MTTALQKAAQAMIDRWESLQYASTLTPQVFEPKILKLRKALDAELAQSVEPWPTQAAIDVLRRFEETCLDNEGYDVPKNTMYVLQAIGLVYRTYRDTYVITDFGERVLKGNSLHPPQPQATTPALRECWYESNELKVCRKCGQMHDKAIAAQGEKL